MANIGCNYCDKGEGLAAFGYEICPLSESVVYVFREQSHPGRVIVAHKNHVGDFRDLPDEQRNGFFADVARVAKAIQAAYNPDKINYGAYGDLAQHLHFHLVPKYKDQFEWGGTFEMNPKKTMCTDEQCEEVAKKIRQHL